MARFEILFVLGVSNPPYSLPVLRTKGDSLLLWGESDLPASYYSSHEICDAQVFVCLPVFVSRG